MILVDANILLYAEDSLCPQHQKARMWWDNLLSQEHPVCLCWTVLSAFIRSLASIDVDFARFPKLKWLNPLSP